MNIKEIFEKCLSLSMKKRQDYTSQPTVNSHENFKRSAEVASWFTDNNDKPYAVLIGTKLARLGSLLSSNNAPSNESINDSFEDLINYCALWYERYQLENPIKFVSSGYPQTCYYCKERKSDYEFEIHFESKYSAPRDIRFCSKRHKLLFIDNYLDQNKDYIFDSKDNLIPKPSIETETSNQNQQDF